MRPLTKMSKDAADISELLKMKCYTKEQSVFIDKQYFINIILVRDEAHFHLDGLVNQQNSDIWGAENPRVVAKNQMHQQRVPGWCGL